MSPLSTYAQRIGVTEADAHTARNIRLSVGDCKHLVAILRQVATAEALGDFDLSTHAREWNNQLLEYLKGAV